MYSEDQEAHRRELRERLGAYPDHPQSPLPKRGFTFFKEKRVTYKRPGFTRLMVTDPVVHPHYERAKDRYGVTQRSDESLFHPNEDWKEQHSE